MPANYATTPGAQYTAAPKSRPKPTIAQRIQSWWRTRQRIRAWQKTPPERQLAIWLDCIDQTPALRDQFRKALRVKGYESMVGEKLAGTVRRMPGVRR